ncbi:MAG: U32 family peptidase [Lachnospiraceae bacterium]|nr:U32 family peptidase [Lachnospiraceae bacterium]
MENAEDKKKENAKGQPQEAALSVKSGKHLPELLAPAGEAIAVQGAFAAGADAVYLGADRFSARAYAKNLSGEELIRVLDEAHILGKKVYLACNILLRDQELKGLAGLMDPLYEHGLDGVIVQDLGALEFMHKRYPLLPLHASTQMSIMSAAGAEWLKKRGVCRVVPARELSLAEIRSIKESGIEVECFIHGAMCYSYSGRCLLSSMAGGRSGNRGRCAGPCRQPYHTEDGRARYYLSMKDMWSLGVLEELLDAGVDSLKIEGRMKAPEYAAGVTAVYRKYLDRYAAGKDMRPEQEDLRFLEGLYMRSGRQEGYLKKHNGRDMISLDSPAYDKVSEEAKRQLREKYLEAPLKLPVDMELFFHAGKAVRLSAETADKKVSLTGAVADMAQKQPLDETALRKQLNKTGDTPFVLRTLKTDTDGRGFMPIKELNGLRREVLEQLKDELLPEKRRPDTDVVFPAAEQHLSEETKLLAGVVSPEQLKAALTSRMTEGIIAELDLFTARPEEIAAETEKAGKKLYLRLPVIVRQERYAAIRHKLKKALAYPVAGVYCGGIDALALAGEFLPEERLIGDQGLYVFNSLTEGGLSGLDGLTVSAEFSGKDVTSLPDHARTEWIIYGRTPLMYSANCIYRTKEGCRPDRGLTCITDELGHAFPLRPVHEYCYNILYNCVPLSLHGECLRHWKEGGFRAFRLEFTTEDAEETKSILSAFEAILQGKNTDFPLSGAQSTRGHYKKGAE